MNRRSVILLFSLLLISIIPITCAFAQPQFEAAEGAVAEADSVEADILSPKTFQKAKEALVEAKKAAAKNKSEKTIQEMLKKVSDFAKKAYETSDIGHKVLKDVLPARERAVAVDAATNAKPQWIAANDLWSEVISDLEDNSLESARKNEREMINRFNKAEVEAIKNTILKTARSAINDAKKSGAESYAPFTLQKARDYAKTAEETLNQTVYAGEKAKEAARLATMEAHHAQKITAMAKRFEKDDGGWEKGFLAYEEYLNGFARRINLELDWNDGGDGAAKQLLLAIDSLRLTTESQMTLKDQQYSFLEQNFKKTRTKLEDDLSKVQLRNAELESRLGIAQRETDVLKRQKELAAMADKLGEQFGIKEATSKVVDPKGTILLRLIGLSFPSGSSTLTSSMQKLLGKVVTGLQDFSSSAIVVEGHTDSQGDETRNKKLSTDRATAVSTFLQTNLGLPAGRISVVGHGSEQPIADNETREGRLQNRRIDILIKVPPQ